MGYEYVFMYLIESGVWFLKVWEFIGNKGFKCRIKVWLFRVFWMMGGKWFFGYVELG